MTERVWFKIGEAAALVGATPKELRYWEKVIPELQPRRSKGNLRYYHQEEIARLQRIRQWLAEGLTVMDCRELLKGTPVIPKSQGPGAGEPSRFHAALKALRSLLGRLSLPPGHPAPAAESEPFPPSPRPRKARVVAPRPKAEPAPPPAEGLLLEPEAQAAPSGSSLPGIPEPKPRRPRKPRPESSALGRMWSETRLPLDWEE